MMRRKLFWIVIMLIGLGIAGAFLFWKERAAEKPAYQEVLVQRNNLQTFVLTTGTVKPQNRLELKPPVAGRVEEVLVEEGDKVHAGQILAWMSSTERAALLDAALSKGTNELTYWKQLYKPTPLVAPLDGDIIARNVERGQTVTASDALYVMSDRLIIEAPVDETDIGRLTLGQRANFTMDAYPQNVISGKVDHIAYEAKTVNNVTTYMVDVLPLEVPLYLRSGMSANITVLTAGTNDVLLVPSEAVHTETSQTVVWQSNPADMNKPLSVPVVTGFSDGKKVEIRSGLKEDDKVLIKVAFKIGAKGNAQKNPFMPGGRSR
jgi:macrolide-specific efflux system membrane fusion protein